MYDVAIIGAGVVGALTARKLAAYKLKTVILEKNNDVAMGTTKANSAIVHAGFDAKEGTLKAKLNVTGSLMMPKITQELSVKYQNNGSLVLAFNDGDMKKLHELYQRGIKNGVKGLSVISKKELFALEPSVSDKAVGALLAKTGAIICPYELTVAAVGNAMDNGVELIRNFCVTEIKRGDTCYHISSENESITARYVVNATGLYADDIAKMAGRCDFHIHPRRGEYFVLDKSNLLGLTHTIFVTPDEKGKGILVSPTVDGNIIVGPTADDILDKEDFSTTDKGASMLREKALKSIPSIDLKSAITSFAGLRAIGDTGDFIINGKDCFVNVAGIESPGLSAAPAIAEYIFSLLCDMGLTAEKNERFNPNRRSYDFFKALSVEEKNKLIRINPSYGKVVCRCECVTEGEIINALTENPVATDIDGVKRRTRSGMGRCQGGFCMPSVAELIAKKLSVNYESVTKFGKGSYLNIGKTKGGNGNA